MDDNKIATTGVDVLEIKQPEDITLTSLSEKDQAAVRAYADKIDVTNTSEVLQYGSTAQQKMTVFADTALESVRTKDTGAVGETLADLVAQLQGFSVDSSEKKGFLGLFRKASQSVATMKARYDKVSVSVDQVANTLEDQRVGLLKDIAMLDRLYDENIEYYRQLCFYIVAGKEKIESLRANDVPKLREKATQSGDPVDAQALNDMEAAIDRFEKKVYDLELTRQISIQMAPQIRLLQNNDSLMADKIHSAMVNTLPLWKSQMVLALGLENSRAAIAAQQAVTDATNKMLKQNAETLKQGTIETAKANERGIVDIETLVETNQKLIESLTEVDTIQREGREQRAAAEQKLRAMEDELKNKLMEIRDRPMQQVQQPVQTTPKLESIAPEFDPVVPADFGKDDAVTPEAAATADADVFNQITHSDDSAPDTDGSAT
ncbi:toxic anion resistance protein [Eubacteriales bacterium OttesenSCG-928-A19]|nr:toxic anion resistance protein [Eubacteriales bacterium OttesenSCG-928-A19]